MSPPRRIGHYRQLPHGDADGPDLTQDVAGLQPGHARPAVAAYLRGCPVVAATAARAADVLDPQARAALHIDVHTDGDYLWTEDLAHYVERYAVAVPPDLVERAIAGAIPDLSEARLGAIADQLLGPEGG